ncbi:hypothetical protein HanXRQr2_Chr10g0432181 [Helianthus annuus]|uniref:Uncharacterized protein n=1 Tax=Helianthus annuus TaxID=4232 RepID=A0A9K3N3B9_HELAN|nr:hypothetical protein HanXRQr2_Chr10g0432181 [Helianthus annuus]
MCFTPKCLENSKRGDYVLTVVRLESNLKPCPLHDNLQPQG